MTYETVQAADFAFIKHPEINSAMTNNMQYVGYTLIASLLT